MKRFVTYVAFICFFTTVGQFMVLIVTLLVEALPAEFADERFVACMNSRVSVKRRAAVEGFATCLTLVRFLRRVNDLVPTQSGSLPETFTTYLAHEGSRTCVHGHVPCQVIMSVEKFPTFRTSETLLFGRRGRAGCRSFRHAVR